MSCRNVEFVIDQLVSSPDQIVPLKNKLKDVDGILAIHLSMGIRPALDEILSVDRPTVFFAVPYSGHEWAGFGALQKQKLGAKLECMLTTDYSRLAAAVRPFRAIHHLREAKILNVTTRSFDEYANAMKSKFGTEIKRIDRTAGARRLRCRQRRGCQSRDRTLDQGGEGARGTFAGGRVQVLQTGTGP